MVETQLHSLWRDHKMAIMNAVKYIISGLLLFCIGIFAGKKLFSQPKPQQIEIEKTVEAPSKNSEYEDLIAQLKGISPEQVKEYLRAQDADTKLKKADEILGKIMQLLVAQVGFRLSKEELDQFGKIPDKAIDNQPPAPAVKQEPTPAPAKDPEQQLVNQRLQTRINGVKSEEQALKFSTMLGNNYAERIQDSRGLSAEQIQELNGKFEGQIIYDKDQKIAKVSMDFQGQLKRQFVEGRWSARILDEQGKETSRSSGRGNLSKDFSGNQNEIFIEVGSRYFQLTYFPQLDSWGGNLLESLRGNYNKVGTVFLKRM